MATGFMDILMSATGTQPYTDPQYAADLENYQNIQSLRNKTLFDTMVEQRQEKRLKDAMGQPGQYQLPPGQEGPQIAGSGLFGSPEEQIIAQALMANINPSAFTPTYTSTMGLPGEIKRAQTGKIGSTVSAREGEGIGTQNVTYAITGFDEAGAPIYGELGRGSQFSPYGKGSGGGGTESYPRLAQLMANGWTPSTRLTKQQMGLMEQSLEIAEKEGRPLSAQDLYDMEFQAVKNRRTGGTAGSRLVIARKQNIEAANGLLEDMETTASKLDYPDVKFAGTLEKWKNGQLNDPLFTEYMTQRADALFVLGNALKQNNLTDKSIAVEEEAFNPTMSPRALKAWLNTQRRALNRAAEEIEKDYRYQMRRSEVAPAGVGGVGERTAPEQMELPVVPRGPAQPERIINFEDLP